MKNIFTVLFLFICVNAVFSEEKISLLIDDFENGNKGWIEVNQGWVTIEIVDNPKKSGVNTSKKVLKCTRKAGTSFWAGAILRNQPAVNIGIEASQYRYGIVKVLKETSGNVGFKVELGGDANSFASEKNYSPDGEWQELKIDLGGANGRPFTDFFIMPDQTNSISQDIVIYIDDVGLESDPDYNSGENVLPGEFEPVWADEFDGDTYNTDIWSAQIAGDGFGNNELQYYTGNSKNIFIRDGNLVLKAYKENYQNCAYTSGKIWTRNKKSIKYGKVEARFKLPNGRGTWPAIWMMPKESVYGGWPKSGEIDIMEFVGYDPNKVHGTVHTQSGYGGNGNGSSIVKNGMTNDYHTISIEWEPGYIKWFLDGEHFYTYNNLRNGFASWPFDQEFYLILNFAVGGDWGGANGIDDSIWPQEFLIDYVRVYQKDESSSSPDIGYDDFIRIKRISKDEIMLNFDSQKPVNISIYSLSGNKEFSTHDCQNNCIIDISFLNDGVYLLSAGDGEKQAVQKFVK